MVQGAALWFARKHPKRRPLFAVVYLAVLLLFFVFAQTASPSSMGYGGVPLLVLAAPCYFLPFHFENGFLNAFLFCVGLVLNIAILYLAAARLGYARSSAKT